MPADAASVLVVGAGISGAACAAALRRAGVTVQVRDRARAPGGRMSAPALHGRPVDLGAAYFTVRDDAFATVVNDWAARGLARPWTDAMESISPTGRETKSGPMRWAALHGLRSLVRDLHDDVLVESPVQALPGAGFGAVVLAMPDPQAARLPTLSAAFDWVDYEPVIAVAAGWTERCWSLHDAAFVNDDPDVTLIVDDGARHGDCAPVLVAHTTAARARAHLDDPDAAVAPVVTAVRRLLGMDAQPAWTHAHRWTLAKPAGTHGDEPFGVRRWDGGLLGACGDSWCPTGSPRVEAAWLSGHRLGSELAARLG